MSNHLVSKRLSPQSIEEVCEAVRAHNDAAIYPIGAGSWMDLGYPRTKPGIEISTLQLNRVVDHPHEELTITVEAGILISELSKILAEKGQMLPFDCPYPDKATLGGLLATNTSGPRRLAYGTARDSVLGLDVVNAQGERIHGGGRVVKNVAGYDMPKMHIGALGTLGIVVEATLKVRPIPKAKAGVEFGVEWPRISEAMASIRRSSLRPVAVEIEYLDPPNDRVVFQVFFEDSHEAVAFQVEQAKLIGDKFSPMVIVNQGSEFDLAFENSVARVADDDQNMCVRMSTSPTHIPAILERLSESLPAPYFKSHAMNGVVWFHWNDDELTEAVEHVRMIGRVATEFHGRFSIPRCPEEWKHKLPIWGDIGPEIEWMRKLRNTLDPNHVLNPGRFVVE